VRKGSGREGEGICSYFLLVLIKEIYMYYSVHHLFVTTTNDFLNKIKFMIYLMITLSRIIYYAF